jgi:hypothetical protein
MFTMWSGLREREGGPRVVGDSSHGFRPAAPPAPRRLRMVVGGRGTLFGPSYYKIPPHTNPVDILE